MLTGSCACGAVHFATRTPPRNPSVCHCTQCRKMSGQQWASAQVPEPELTITGPVSWIALTHHAKRGICATCGAFLFWQGNGETEISFALGAVDGPTGLQLEKHIFTADQGDYYSIADGLPQHP